MRISKFRGLAASALTACALLTTGAAAAQAAPAVWNTTGTVVVTPSGAFTIKIGATPNAANTITCSTVASISSNATTTAGVGYLSGLAFAAPDAANGFCYDGTGGPTFITFLTGTNAMQGVKTGAVYSMSALNTMYIRITSAYVDYTAPFQATTYTAPWTNGTSAVNPSTMTLTNATVGITSASTGNQPIKLTGTFKLKTSAGGLLTLI